MSTNRLCLPEEIDLVLVNPAGIRLSEDVEDGFPQGDLLQVYLFEFADRLREVLQNVGEDGDCAPGSKLLGCKTFPNLTRGGSIIFHLPEDILKLSERTPSSFKDPKTTIDFRGFLRSLPPDQKVIVPEIPSLVKVCWAMSRNESGQVVHRHMSEDFKGKTLWVAPYQFGSNPMNKFVNGAHENVSYQDLFAVLKNVAEALKIAHDQGVCHGDVKPSNVFVKKDPGGRCHGKLFDWETAMPFGAAAVGLNTPEYAMSTYLPEGAKLPVNYPYDMLALGATMLRICIAKDVKNTSAILKTAIRGARSLGRVHPIKDVLPANLAPDVKRELAQLIFDLIQADSSVVPNATQVIARIDNIITSG